MKYIFLFLVLVTTLHTPAYGDEWSRAFSVRARLMAVTPECMFRCGRLVVIQSKETNAWAGKKFLVVTKTIINKTKSDDELAFIIGHEMGHYLQPKTLSGKAAEFDADTRGMSIMKRAGYNPMAAITFLNRLHVTFASPSSSERIRNLMK